jgi:hypothetical protein
MSNGNSIALPDRGRPAGRYQGGAPHYEPGASALSQTQLTIDHFEVDAANRGLE